MESDLITEALRGIPEGFAYYDADDRLAVFNSNMPKFYPLIAKVFRRDTRFEEVLAKGIERGQYVEAEGREDEFFRERLAYHRNPKGAVLYVLPDGRCIKVEEKKTPDGGIVGNRADVTSLYSLVADLETIKSEAPIIIEGERLRIAGEIRRAVGPMDKKRVAGIKITPKMIEAGRDVFDRCEITPLQFEEAYQIWRDRLVEESREGLPVADGTSARLLQAVRQQLHFARLPTDRQ